MPLLSVFITSSLSTTLVEREQQTIQSLRQRRIALAAGRGVDAPDAWLATLRVIGFWAGFAD